jgi:hypothetical protein
MKLNDLPQQQPSAIPAAPIVAGSVWQYIDGSPWQKETAHKVKIIDAKEGWVRYSSTVADDDRMREANFRQNYQPTNQYATGELLKVPVPRDELEGALADMLLAFHYREGNFATRDAAVRRAQLALGSQVTL